MTILVYLFLLLNALVILGPVIWTVMSSLKLEQSFSSGFTEISFTLEHYHNLLTGTPYLKWYKNTFILATCNMLISLVVVTITAFIFQDIVSKPKKYS
jgi:arabinogalactan oligomer/maltooligosaccharide transport system permease protein